MTHIAFDCDVAVIGGGPAGSVTAYELAQKGRTVMLFEKSPAPSFHIGESMLPRTATELADMGLLGRIEALPHVVKRGASFVSASGVLPAHHLAFAQALDGDATATFNIEREFFDAELLNAAGDAGATIRRGTTIRTIESLDADNVVLRTAEGESVRCRSLVDASGHGTIVGRKLGTRKVLAGHERVAYFSHLTNVRLPEGDPSGYGVIVMFDEGWFWLIPIDAERTSVGVVLPVGLAASAGIPASAALNWAIPRCPEMVKRCSEAGIPPRNHVIANFSYTCRPFAGPGWMLAGDAAGFMDPIFSGGVTLAILSGRWAAGAIDEALTDSSQWSRVARAYTRQLDRSMKTLFSMIENYYQPAYRDMLHHGSGPCQVHLAAVELLTGRAFPRPRFAVAWRLMLMKIFQAIQRHHPLVPRMPCWSILTEGDTISESTLESVNGSEDTALDTVAPAGCARNEPSGVPG